MAPISLLDSTLPSDLSVSSLELDRRTSPAELPNRPIGFSLFHSKRDSGILSPIEANAVLIARDPTPPPTYNPGSGAVAPTDINNEIVLIFFGILSAGFVIASIWFFFWAKNGGCVWRKGDWEEYKSTVLRRKGPNGTTLSGATKTTELGGGSIVHDLESRSDGTYASSESAVIREKVHAGKRKGKKVKKNSHDDDVRAYRHEKVAKVGGLNKEADGSYHDYTNTEPSEVSTPHRVSHSASKKTPSRKFSYNPGAESTFSVYSDDSHRPLRASPAHGSHSNTSTPTHTPTHVPTRSRQTSPTKRSSNSRAPPPATYHRHSRQPSSRGARSESYIEPIDFESRYTESVAETEQSRGTKAYFHPIPELAIGAGRDVGRAGNRDSNGFRRGGGRRRDSLSDSEGETETVMS
jgi:hypothetical protein